MWKLHPLNRYMMGCGAWGEVLYASTIYSTRLKLVSTFYFVAMIYETGCIDCLYLDIIFKLYPA